MSREPKDPSRLLEDLESIRTLLDDEPASPAASHSTAAHDIPLLQDIISSSHDVPSAPPDAETSDPSQNPFLPYDSLARLAGERVHLERLLNEHAQPASRDDLHTGAREVRLEARLHAEAQLILQDVIDELLPLMEAELRQRLSDKLDQLVREQIEQWAGDN